MCGLSRKQLWRRQPAQGVKMMKSTVRTSTDKIFPFDHRLILLSSIFQDGDSSSVTDSASEETKTYNHDDAEEMLPNTKEQCCANVVLVFEVPAIAVESKRCADDVLPPVAATSCELVCPPAAIVHNISPAAEVHVPIHASNVHPVVRKVHFLPEVSVVLIPSLAEYKEANLFEALWWNSADFKRFQVNMVHSLNQYMYKTACFDKRQAFKMLNMDDTFEMDAEPIRATTTSAPR